MPFKNPELMRQIEEIANHYQNNINNRYIRKALMTMDIPQSEWDLIEGLTAKSDYYKSQGYQFHELYDQILAVARFINKARRELLPNLRFILSEGTQTVLSRTKGTNPFDQNKILRDMAIKNFSANLQILADMINELYIKTVKLDKELHKTKPPVFKRIPELEKLGQLLIE